MSIKYIICKNCERTFKDEYNFCPYCGQDDKEKLTLGVLFYNTISNYFSVDARFFKSFIPLMAKPGYLPQRFVQGKRLLYLHPAQMYLFISVIFFFLFSFISRDQIEKDNSVLNEDSKPITVIDSTKINERLKKEGIEVRGITDLDSILKTQKSNDLNSDLISFDFNKVKADSLIKLNAPEADILKSMGMPDDAGFFKRKLYSQMLKLYKQRNGGSLLQGFYDSIPIAMFVLLPIFAFILKLLYYKKGSFSHHLVFSFYFFAFLFMVFSFLVFIDLVFEISFWIELLVMLSTFFYLFLAVKRFYGEGYFLSFIKSNVAAMTFLLFVAPLAAAIMFLIAFLFY
ncbi:DUF3667 domain-containing protein [Confluentibacter lentus]|uniref:DUF3667 domain-containing protein n=1 Tax=Confluentibacter lentus TaxID=1699412 RepID=UPI000C282AA5|nr:DUF3667 domain-containing protein [Confluentibacter lentus]